MLSDQPNQNTTLKFCFLLGEGKKLLYLKLQMQDQFKPW